jgi:nucleotide-binding universal stress UspA family protein
MTGNTEPRVIVGVDGSEGADLAVEHAAREAVLRGLPLEIVTVWNVVQYSEWPVPEEATGKDAERMVQDAAIRVRDLYPQLEPTVRTTQGNTIEQLLVAGSGATLMVLGSRGRGTVAELLLGSVSLSVAAYTTCPLLVVRPGVPTPASGDGGERTVVLGLAGSECLPAVEAAFEEARLRGLRLRVISTWTDPIPTPLPIPPTRESSAAARALRHGAIEAVLAQVRPGHPTVEVDIEIPRDTAAHALIAASHRADVVVLAAHRRTARFGTRLGRVGHTLLHHSHAPALLVPVD